MTFDRAELARAAGVDPWALHAQVSAGDPAGIEQLAAAFYRAAGHTGDAADADARATRYVRAGYTVHGAAVADARAGAGVTAARLHGSRTDLDTIARLLAGVGDDLVTARAGAGRATSSLGYELAAIERRCADYTATTRAGTPAEKLSGVAEFRARAVNAVRNVGHDVAAVVDTYESSLTAATRSLARLGYVAPFTLDAAPPAVPAASAGAARVARWWRELTPAQQRALVLSDYERLGTLRGLPAGVLDAANRRRIEDHLAGIDAELTRLRRDPSADPDGSRRAALERARSQDTGILDALVAAHTGSGAPARLLRYSPTATGHTGAELAIGDPDRAANTAVVVPGTGSDTAHLIDVTTSKGLPIYRSMGSGSRAVVVWLDGPEPAHVFPRLGGSVGELVPDAALDAAAAASAPRLTADLGALRAAHVAASGDGGHVTAIGHSYGTYILGRALTGGASSSVDDVVFTGSPGVGVDRAADLGMDPAHVWSGQTGNDPILAVKNRFTPGMHGINPEQHQFGARHFDVTGSHGHGQYFQGRSLHNIAAIAAGRWADVGTVPAPDFHGLVDLPGDAADALIIDPAQGGRDVIGDVMDGDLGQLGGDVVFDGAREVGHVTDTVRDVFSW